MDVHFKLQTSPIQLREQITELQSTDEIYFKKSATPFLEESVQGKYAVEEYKSIFGY
jgi:hypothetical protein